MRVSPDHQHLGDHGAAAIARALARVAALGREQCDGTGSERGEAEPLDQRLRRFERCPRNLMIVSGTAAEVQSVQDTIGIFDVDWLRGMSLGLYPLDNVDPVTLEAELTGVLNAQVGGERDNADVAGDARQEHDKPENGDQRIAADER